jgi:hypothetical protein
MLCFTSGALRPPCERESFRTSGRTGRRGVTVTVPKGFPFGTNGEFVKVSSENAGGRSGRRQQPAWISYTSQRSGILEILEDLLEMPKRSNEPFPIFSMDRNEGQSNPEGEDGKTCHWIRFDASLHEERERD